MFAINTKAKVAAGVAAGALMLGAAGAYAASANNTITVQNPTPIVLPSNGPTLISVDNVKLTTPLPTFANHGACISFFASNRDFALAPSPLPSPSSSASVKVSKNYHGKLISGLQSWCKSQVTTSSPTTTSDTTGSTGSGAPSGQGNSHGHGKHGQ